MTTRYSRFGSVPFTAAFAIALALPQAGVARPANTRPAGMAQVESKNAKDLPTVEAALPARRSCHASDDSDYTDDVAGGPETGEASTGIEVGIAEPGDPDATFKADDMLEMSDEEAAAYDAAVAEYEKRNQETDSCDEGDGNASADE